jgi:hypothetical protein
LTGMIIVIVVVVVVVVDVDVDVDVDGFWFLLVSNCYIVMLFLNQFFKNNEIQSSTMGSPLHSLFFTAFAGSGLLNHFNECHAVVVGLDRQFQFVCTRPKF